MSSGVTQCAAMIGNGIAESSQAKQNKGNARAKQGWAKVCMAKKEWHGGGVMRKEVKDLAALIIAAHDGQALYNMGECAKILGQGRNNLPSLLHSEGISVKKLGQEKMVDAMQLAEFICKNNVAPIDNMSRGATVAAATGGKR